MKTKEELNTIKEECESLSKKLSELSEDELTQVTGGDVTSANCVGYVPHGNGVILVGQGRPLSGTGNTDEKNVADTLQTGTGYPKIKTGDTRKQLTAEQLTPEYIHRQIFGSKFDEVSGD